MSDVRFYKDGEEEKEHPDYDFLRLIKVKLISNETMEYPSTEKILFVFLQCDKDGQFNFDVDRYNIEVKLDVGWRDDNYVKAELFSKLSGFRIYDIKELCEAFKYRHYYN